jgi:hypothetical protein
MNRIITILFLILSTNIYSQCLGFQTGNVGGLFPAPTILNGVPTYPPNTTVTVCYTLQSFNEIGGNWLEGFDINLGSGWNMSTLTPMNPPGNCGGNGTGVWLWMNSVTSSPPPPATGITVGPGWFFEDGSGIGGPVDGNPGNDWGDQEPFGTNCIWNFCFQITTNNDCTPGQSLYIAVTAGGDGNWGSWTNPACGLVPYVMLTNNSTINNQLPSLGLINHN